MSTDDEPIDLPADDGAGAEDPAPASNPPAVSAGVPVVGIGASAGGLEAFLEMVEALPPDTGLAFIFVLHLTASHVSSLPELVAGRTAMRVAQAADGLRIE